MERRNCERCNVGCVVGFDVAWSRERGYYAILANDLVARFFYCEKCVREVLAEINEMVGRVMRMRDCVLDCIVNPEDGKTFEGRRF